MGDYKLDLAEYDRTKSTQVSEINVQFKFTGDSKSDLAENDRTKSAKVKPVRV